MYILTSSLPKHSSTALQTRENITDLKIKLSSVVNVRNIWIKAGSTIFHSSENFGTYLCALQR
jgi:hypothetical protein